MTLSAPRRLLAQPLTVVGGRYRLLEPIGSGATGEVWRAQHVNVGSFAAVKLVALGREDPEMLARVLTEAQAAASLRSAHVVQVFDQGTEGELAYIAMELLSGESLADRLSRGGITPQEIARIVRDVARAVGKAHANGIIHRDLKPQNIFLTQNEGVPVAKVLDFGIAKIVAAQGATREGVVVGTPAYMSPEQVSGVHAVDWRSDLWQLAIIAFECLTGRLPYAATTMGELFVQIASTPPSQAIRPGELAPAFEAWFRRATEHDPQNRFQSARELADELARAIAPSVVLESPSGTSPAPWELGGADDSGRRRMYGLAVGLACTAILLMIALGVTLSRPSRSVAAPAIASAPPPQLQVEPPEPAVAAPPEPEEPRAAASAAPSASSSGPSPPVKPPGPPGRPSRGHDPWGI